MSLLIDNDRNKSILQRVVTEDVRKGSGDDCAKPVCSERPGRMFTARATAKVISGQQDLRALVLQVC